MWPGVILVAIIFKDCSPPDARQLPFLSATHLLSPIKTLVKSDRNLVVQISGNRRMYHLVPSICMLSHFNNDGGHHVLLSKHQGPLGWKTVVLVITTFEFKDKAP